MKLVQLTDSVAIRMGDEAAVRMICESGFDGIDYSMFFMSDDDNVLEREGFKKYVKNLRNIAAIYGVTFEQAHAPFPSMREGDSEYNKKLDYKLKRALEVAGLLDAKICVVHPTQFSSDQKERNLEFYKNLEPYARDFGVKIALENMWGWDTDHIVPNVCSNAPEFNDYYDSLESDAFTCCLDLGHCGLVGDDAASMIRQMGNKRLGALHIHDNDNLHDSHTLPYLMEMDWDSILKALGEIDYKGHFTFEAESFFRGFPEDLLPACLRFSHDVGRSMMRKIEKYRVKR